MFGCKTKPVSLQLEPLCDNVTIDSGGNKGKEILVFRGGKFWQFDGKSQKGKPFGDIKSGNLLAKNKWPGLHFPAGIGQNGDKLLAIYDKSCQHWTPNGDPKDEMLNQFEDKCAPAIVPMPNQKMVLVDKEQVLEKNAMFKNYTFDCIQVWYFRKKGKKLIKDSKQNGPHRTDTMRENIPPDICAAYTDDFNIYYFFKDDKYCKRPLKMGL